jgi:hypothetical protein
MMMNEDLRDFLSSSRITGKEKWTTKSGQSIAIKEMGTMHLINVLNMFMKSAPKFKAMELVALQREENSAWSVASMLQGEMASYEADRAISELMDR